MEDLIEVGEISLDTLEHMVENSIEEYYPDLMGFQVILYYRTDSLSRDRLHIVQLLANRLKERYRFLFINYHHEMALKYKSVQDNGLHLIKNSSGSFCRPRFLTIVRDGREVEGLVEKIEKQMKIENMRT